MPAKFVVVPQWQGASSSRAMRLVDGAEAIRGDLPAAATRSVEVPLGAGDAVATGVSRYSTLAVVRERIALALASLGPDDVPVLIGGDCAIELAGVVRAVDLARRSGRGLGVVGFAAHPGLHSPGSSTSGAFAGMVLRALLGDGADGLTAEPALRPGEVVVVGARTVDDAEDAWATEQGVALLPVETTPEQLADAVAGWDEVYVHVDLDVLDPASFEGLLDPQPFGMEPGALTAAIAAAVRGRRLVGAGLAMFAPASDDAAARDLPTILRILSAITAPTRTAAPRDRADGAA